MTEERDLPGWPKQRLVKRVRSHLWRYGIRPKGSAWRATWSWAYAIANSYFRTHWPLAFEIATQYVALLLAEMNENRALTLLQSLLRPHPTGQWTALPLYLNLRQCHSYHQRYHHGQETTQGITRQSA